MKIKTKLLVAFLIFGSLLSVALAGIFYFSIPDQQSLDLTAILNEISGHVQYKIQSDGPWRVGVNGTEVEPGSEVATGPDGRARMDLSDGSIIRLGENSAFVIQKIELTEQGLVGRFKVNFGQIWIILNGGVIEVDTPSGIASVRGSYMSLSIDPNSGEVFLTCLEGSCVMTTQAGELSMVAGQTATVLNFDSPPTPGVISDEVVQEWLAHNPEATVIMPAVTATVRASRPDVRMPILNCLGDNSCASYCSPVGWDPSSGQLPPLEQIPQDCVDAALELLWQGIDPEMFIGCVLLGGFPQICANDSVEVHDLIPNTSGVPLVQLPPLSCLDSNSCSSYCAPIGWDPNSNTVPPVESIPAECVSAGEAMIAQGVDPWLFIKCVIATNNVQACADASVVR